MFNGQIIMDNVKSYNCTVDAEDECEIEFMDSDDSTVTVRMTHEVAAKLAVTILRQLADTPHPED